MEKQKFDFTVIKLQFVSKLKIFYGKSMIDKLDHLNILMCIFLKYKFKSV